MQTTDAARAPRPPGELGQDRSWLALRRGRRGGGRAGVRRRRGGLLRERGRRGRRRRGRAARGRGLLGSGRRRRRRRIQLAARDPGQQRQRLAPVEALLLVLHVVVFEVRLVRRLRRITQDLRADEHDEVVLGRGRVARLEEQPEERDVPQVGHALLALDAVVLDEPAEHHDAAVLDQHRGGDRALVGDQVDRTGGLLTDARALDRDLEHERGALGGDGRRDLENGADLLALNGLERIDAARDPARGRRRIGELAGNERHFLRHLELGLLVVHGHRRRRREDIGVGVAAQRAQRRGEIHAGSRDATYADRGSLQERARGIGRVLDGRRQVHDAGAADRTYEGAGWHVAALRAGRPVDAVLGVPGD